LRRQESPTVVKRDQTASDLKQVDKIYQNRLRKQLEEAEIGCTFAYVQSTEPERSIIRLAAEMANIDIDNSSSRSLYIAQRLVLGWLLTTRLDNDQNRTLTERLARAARIEPALFTPEHALGVAKVQDASVTAGGKHRGKQYAPIKDQALALFKERLAEGNKPTTASKAVSKAFGGRPVARTIFRWAKDDRIIE
jgi:hypothetical protein